VEKIKVLVVDDKRVIGDLFGYILGYSGHDVTVVQDGLEAIELIKTSRFDVVFLDIVMPEPDGVTVLERIKSLSPNTPVVMMSGYSIHEKRQRAKELGAVTCLKKPFEMDEVRQALKMALGKEI